MIRMDVSEVRGTLATVVDRVRRQQSVIVIVRYGRALAALVPITRLTTVERQRLTPRSNGAPVARPPARGRSRKTSSPRRSR